MSAPVLPEPLRTAIQLDSRPVRPLPAPIVRAIAVLPLGLLVMMASPWWFGTRHDGALLGTVRFWGFSVAQATLALVLIAASFREALPGNSLPRLMLGGILLAAGAGMATVTFLTYAASPTTVPPKYFAIYTRVCLTYPIAMALPLVAVAGGLVRRGLPLRPAAAGLLYGLGAGLLADAGWRLFCEVSSPSHVLLAHGGAILSSGMIGAFFAVLLERLRSKAHLT